MPQSLSRVVVHGIFSTKNRETLLHSEIRGEVFAYLATVLRNDGHIPIAVGGHLDHVHFLFGLSRTVTIAKTIENVKVSSSKWIKTKGKTWEDFSWQSGYAAFGISESEIKDVSEYIRNHDSHHTKISFQDEFRKLLTEYGIEFDERYVWD